MTSLKGKSMWYTDENKQDANHDENKQEEFLQTDEENMARRGSAFSERNNSKSSSEDENNDRRIEFSRTTLKRNFCCLCYSTLNGLKHAFYNLDANRNGALAKTQLQLFCASISAALNLAYKSEDLVAYENDKKELQFDEFIRFVEDEYLKKVSDSKIDSGKIDHFAWTIIEKERSKYRLQILTDDEIFRLWQAFNKIDIEQVLLVHIEEAIHLLRQFMHGMGTVWNRSPLDEYTNQPEINFWQLAECLETKYITQNLSKSIYEEGLIQINNVYNLEIRKCGFLTKRKKGLKSSKHRWFVLHPDRICYFEGKNKRARQKGVIAINKDSSLFNDGKSNIFTLKCCVKGVEYELEANDPKSMNEWMSEIKHCIEHLKMDKTPLLKELEDRKKMRDETKRRIEEEEKLKAEQDEIIRKQLEELRVLKEAREQAEEHAHEETARLQAEKRRREQLERTQVVYEQLLEEEKEARIQEAQARALQDQMLESEKLKRLELEKIKAEQEEILTVERAMREGWETVSKDQAKALEEERGRLRALEADRESAEAELACARGKLQAAEEERRQAASKVEQAKDRTRKMTCSVGLAKPIQHEVLQPITHRGAGSFVEEDFSKTPLYLTSDRHPTAVNKSDVPSTEKRAQIVQQNLVKPSQSKHMFEMNVA